MMSTLSHGVDPKWDALQDLLKVVTDPSATRDRIQQLSGVIATQVKAKADLDAAQKVHAQREAAINQRAAEQNQRDKELQQREAAAAQKSASAESALALAKKWEDDLHAKDAAIADTHKQKQAEWTAGDEALAARTTAIGKLEAQLKDQLAHAAAREATAQSTIADYNARVERLREATK